ncbi:MAG: hypothetical protein R2704_17875 [Microthrixaceae bacterium]
MKVSGLADEAMEFSNPPHLPEIGTGRVDDPGGPDVRERSEARGRVVA